MEHILLSEVLAASRQWLEHFNQGNTDFCVAGYAPDAKDLELITRFSKVPAQTWFQIFLWAKETNNLQPWQRGIAYSLGKLAANHNSPSYKQAFQGVKILQEAEQLGFKYRHKSNSIG